MTRRALFLGGLLVLLAGGALRSLQASGGHGGGKDHGAAAVAARYQALSRQPGGLLMLCGAGLRPPMEALRKEFEKHTRIPLRVVYGGSACLLAQAEITRKSRPCDLYAPGERFYVEQAKGRGLIAQAGNLCYMIPVIMVRRGNPKWIRTLRDLTRPGIRLGVGEAKTCAIGKTTQDLLRKNHLEQAVAPNIRMHTALAPEMGNAIRLGALDAAINWDAVASWYEDGADVVPIPPTQNCIVQVPLGMLSCARNQQLARAFYNFATSPAGRAIFRQQRYTTDLRQPIYPYKGTK